MDADAAAAPPEKKTWALHTFSYLSHRTRPAHTYIAYLHNSHPTSKWPVFFCISSVVVVEWKKNERREKNIISLTRCVCVCVTHHYLMPKVTYKPHTIRRPNYGCGTKQINEWKIVWEASPISSLPPLSPPVIFDKTTTWWLILP